MRHILVILIGLLLAAGNSHAETLRFQLAEGMDMDETGEALRRAVDSFQSQENSSGEQKWEQVQVALGQNKKLTDDLFIVLLEVSGDEQHRVLLVTNDGNHMETFEPGEEKVLGPRRVLLTEPASAETQVSLDARTSSIKPATFQVGPASKGSGAGNSSTGIKGYPGDRELVVTSPSEKTLKFSGHFLEQLKAGNSAEHAASAARRAVGNGDYSYQDQRENRRSTRERDYASGDGALPHTALVTIRLVRGNQQSINRLASSISYTNQGQTTDEPRVGVETGPEGGEVSVGEPGDRFQMTLRTLEKNREVNTEAETFVRVPLGGSTHFDLFRRHEEMSASISAQLRGRKTARLRIYNQQGDWREFGRLNTSAQVRDGQTIMLARNQSERTTQSSSGVPILRDIPFIGPVFNSERETREARNYALFATVGLE